MTTNKLMSTQELADYLRVPVGTLYSWRHEGRGPVAVKVGRHLRFRIEDVEAWIAEHRDEPRSATA